MPRYTRKISLATAVGPKPKASIETTDWKRIACVYGNVLPRPAQQAVLEVSNRYLSLAMFELTAESVRDTVKRLKEITRGAHQLMDGLSKCGGASAAAMHATRLIERHLKNASLPKDETVNSVLLLMGDLVGACASGLRDLEHEAAKNYYRPGEHWEAWVVGLTKIMRVHGLPTAVPKDSDKRTRDIPFVALVRGLQMCMPAPFRRHTQSDDALGQAIYRARRAPGHAPGALGPRGTQNAQNPAE